MECILVLGNTQGRFLSKEHFLFGGSLKEKYFLSSGMEGDNYSLDLSKLISIPLVSKNSSKMSLIEEIVGVSALVKSNTSSTKRR